MGNVDGLFGRTDVAEIEGFLWFLHQVEETVFQLMYNGRLTQIGDHTFGEEEYGARDVGSLLQRLKF